MKSNTPWHPAQAPPPARRPYAHKLAPGGRYAYSAPDAVVDVGHIDESAMSFPAVITTADEDRVGDVVVPEGCDATHFRLAPGVFFGHQEMPLPIGKAVGPDGRLHVFVEPGRRVLSRCFVVQRGRWAETAADIFHLVVEGALCGVSIGFNPLGPTEKREGGGTRYPRWDLLEWSVVGVAANPACAVIRSYLSRGRITGKTINPLVRKSLEPLAEPPRAWAPGFTPRKSTAMATKEAMGETSGPDGGYAAESVRDGIKAVAEAHADGGNYFHNPEDDSAHHQFKEGTPDDTLTMVKHELEEVPGVSAVTQSPDHPGGGHEQVHPEPEPAGEEGEAKKGKPKRRKAAKKKASPPRYQARDDDAGGEEGEDEEAPADNPMGDGSEGGGAGGGKPDPAEVISQLVGVLTDYLNLTAAAAPAPPPPGTPGRDAPGGEVKGDEEEETEGGADEAPGADGEDVVDDEDDEKEEEALERYRRGGKAARPAARKGAPPQHRRIIKEAADHLHEVASLDGGRYTRRHAMTCRAHARALDALLGGMSGGDGGAGEPEQKPIKPDEGRRPDIEEKGLDAAAILAALTPVIRRVEELDEAMYRVTGTRR